MDAVERLLNWWVRPSEPTEGVFLADLLGQDGESGGDARALMTARASGEPWQDLTVLSKVFEGAHAAIMFEGLEPITMLWHRVAWHLVVNDGRIASVWQATQILGTHRSGDA